MTKQQQMPFVNPLGSATIIGAPKIEDFPILSDQEMLNISGPLQQALQGGMDPQQPAAIPGFILARMVQTIRFSQEQFRYMYTLIDTMAKGVDAGEIEIDPEQFKELYQGLMNHLQAVDHAQMSHAKREQMRDHKAEFEESLKELDPNPHVEATRSNESPSDVVTDFLKDLQ